MQSQRRVQQVPGGEPDVEDEVLRVAHDVRGQTGATTSQSEVVLYDEELVDSQVIITLIKGQREPEARCTKAGRMTGQMIMGQEGATMMRIDNELRRAQLALRRATGAIPPVNTKTLEERLFMTPTKEKDHG